MESKGILIAMITFVFCLIVMEFSLRAFVPVRNVGPSFSEYDPFYGKRLKPNFAAMRTTPEFKMRFTTNSLGFRGEEPVPSDLRPIVFIGDSFTMGYGVSDGFEFPALVTKRLVDLPHWQGRPVMNAGIGDSGNGRPLKFIRREDVKASPELIVLQITENDFTDNLREHLFKLDAHGKELIELAIPGPHPMQIAQSWIEVVPVLSNLHLVGFLHQVAGTIRRSLSGKVSKKAVQDDRLTYKLIEEFLSLTAREQFTTLVLTVGVRDDRFAKLSDLSARYHADVLRMPSKRERPDLYYVTDGHWNESGHAQAADMIVDWMKGYAAPLVLSPTIRFARCECDSFRSGPVRP